MTQTPTPTLVVRPAPGVRVRDPFTRAHLAAGGATVPDTTYWRRRLIAGDVVLAAPAASRAVARARERSTDATKE